MKKTILICFIYLLATVVLPSCKKTESEPQDLYNFNLVFDKNDINAVLAQQYLTTVYNYLPTGFTRIGGDFLDAGTDDAVSSINNTSISYYTNGIVSTSNNPDSYWSNSYAGIRQANIFLANIDQVPVPTSNPTRTIGWKAEVRFIRAFLYWELVKRYGGVPIIGDKIFTLTDNLQLKRDTYADCVNYIVSELDAIKGSLYADAISDPNLGRITTGAAIALKCRVYLYAASPLFNGGGIETDPTAKALTGYPTTDATRWQKVVDAVTEFNALGYYNLVGSGFAGYTSVFITKKNTEVILAKQNANNFDLENTDAPIGYNGSSSASLGRTSPTQNFVDAFTMNTGLTIAEPGTTYNASTPYANRDPRLDAIVFYNGGPKWLGRAPETFEGGRDKPNSNAGTQTRTGYYLRKFLADFSTASSYSSVSHNFVYFRYAEIILNNAEALNELAASTGQATTDPAAVNEIIKIRKRAGIQAGASSRYGIKVGISPAEMRDLIRNERRIELSFEEHRFWDLRRWKIATTELNKTLTGMKITKDASNNLTYQVFPVTNITFQDRLYHMPLPYDETVKDGNLAQNFGW